jgi:hypothetical protein
MSTVFPRLRRLLLVSGAVSFVVGCAEVPGIPAPTHAATVFGHVTTSSGAPVQGASVMVTADRSGRCPADDAEYLDLPGEHTITDAAGAYRAQARVFLDVLRGCIRVDVLPPPGAPLSHASVSAGAVRFGAQPLDSVRVDVKLPPG